MTSISLTRRYAVDASEPMEGQLREHVSLNDELLSGPGVKANRSGFTERKITAGINSATDER
jgi:hypothetical protein